MPKPNENFGRVGTWKPIYLVNCRTPAGIDYLRKLTKSDQSLLKQSLLASGSALASCIYEGKSTPRTAQLACESVCPYIATLTEIPGLEVGHSSEIAAECLYCALKFWGFELIGSKPAFLAYVASSIGTDSSKSKRVANALKLDISAFDFKRHTNENRFYRVAFKSVDVFASSNGFKLERLFESVAEQK